MSDNTVELDFDGGQEATLPLGLDYEAAGKVLYRLDMAGDWNLAGPGTKQLYMDDARKIVHAAIGKQQ